MLPLLPFLLFAGLSSACIVLCTIITKKGIIDKLKEKYFKRKLIVEAGKNAIDVGIFDQQSNEYLGKETFTSKEGVDSSIKTGMLLYT